MSNTGEMGLVPCIYSGDKGDRKEHVLFWCWVDKGDGNEYVLGWCWVCVCLERQLEECDRLMNGAGCCGTPTGAGPSAVTGRENVP